MIDYKQLSNSDIQLLKELLKVFGQAFEDIDTYQKAIPNDEYLRGLLSKPHFITLVAMENGEVVGGLTAYELDKFEQDRREIYIYDLAVSEQYRRKGIATGLIKELKQIAKERKSYVIFVQADQGDEPAIKLYESFSKKQNVYQFDIGVSD